LDTIPEASFDDLMALAQSANVLEHPSVPGWVIRKSQGGWTGDSDTTWVNTVGLQIILMYCFWRVHGIPPSSFLADLVLANTGDDNCLGADFAVDQKAIVKAAAELGVELSFDAAGSILDQCYLSKYPRPGDEFADDFVSIGIPVPEFAVLHHRDKLLMRFFAHKSEKTNKLKADADDRYFYLMEKALGYACSQHINQKCMKWYTLVSKGGKRKSVAVGHLR